MRLSLPVRTMSTDRETPSVVVLVRRHAVALGFVLVLVAAMVLPRWWMLTTDPEVGVRVSVSPYGASRMGYDESLYAAAVRHVMDGQLSLSDPFLANHQDDPMQPSSAWHLIVGVAARGTGDVFSSLAIITAIATAVAFVLLYALMYQVTGSRLAAVALIPIVVMAIQAFNQADGILALRHWSTLKPIVFIDPQREWHVWLRYPAPAMALAPFFAAVIALPHAVETGRRIWVVAAAVALALLVYSYLFYWTAMLVALAGWGCWMLYERDYPALRRLVIVGGIAILLAVPEFVVLFRSELTAPSGASGRLGLGPLGFEPSFITIVGQRLIVGIPFLIWLIPRRSRRERLYLMLFLSPLVLTSVSGLVPQPWHYRTQVFGVFAISACIAGATAAYRRLPRSVVLPRTIALACLAGAAVGYFGLFQARSIQQTDASFAVRSDEDVALRWIREHVSRSETIVSPSITTNLYLASLTPASEYLGEGWSSRATDEELTDRMLRAQAAYGYSEDDVFSRLDVTDSSGGFPVNDPTGTPAELERKLERFLAYYTFQFEITDERTFDNRVQSWRTRFRDMQSERDVLAPYRADYLYCGRRERFYAAPHPAPGTLVTTAFEEGAVTIYRLAGPNDPEARAFAGC